MRCHYEVLGIDRGANDEEIKKAYKKQALKWHPDKNLENGEEAKENFQLIQQAWEVLSDSRERKWYDDHREDILRGAEENHREDYLDVFQYFTASCFKGYGDDEKGFYSVYREVFNKIATEDSEYLCETDIQVPGFGLSTSDFVEIVQPFYAYWTGYCTRNTYSWLDEYNVKDAPNRNVWRAMEKHNKKIRDSAKKKRNEEVRNLVAYVRKRDKRVEEWKRILEQRAKENALKSENKRLEVIKARKSDLLNYTESEWAKFSNFEKELEIIESNCMKEFDDESEGSGFSDEDDSDNEKLTSKNQSLFCLACHKSFHNEKSFANHEKSKKHKENVEILKSHHQSDYLNDFSDGSEQDTDNEVEDEDDGDDETCDSNDNSVKCKKNRKLKTIHQLKETKHFDDDSDLDDALLNSTDSEEICKKPVKNTKRKKKSRQSKIVDMSALKLLKKLNEKIEMNGKSVPESLNQCPPDDQKVKNEPLSASKKKKSQSKKKNSDQNCCAKCFEQFPSKNKLYQHLEVSGHALPKTMGDIKGKKTKQAG